MDELRPLIGMPGHQCTVQKAATVCGFGYWSGQDVTVEFRPAEVSAGIVFVRSDMPGCPQIRATVENRIDVPLRTSLRQCNATVDMVEHVLAAVAGLGIDNCEIWVDAAEMPGCDGSCLPFVQAIDSVGIVEQNSRRKLRHAVQDVVRLGNESAWIEAKPTAQSQTILSYQLDYGPQSPIRQQSFQLLLTPESFRQELAPCRTFCLKSEAEQLLAKGLGTRASYRDLLVFGPEGLIDNTLRFPDECARHKILDMVGDFALTGGGLSGTFTAYRSGHRLNAELIRSLFPSEQAMTERYRRCA